MKPVLLSLSLCCALALPTFAQDARKNGYDTLVAAGKMILPDENGSPWATEKFSPEEKLRRQRLAVARNAPALKLMREALKKPIIAPPLEKHGDILPAGINSFRDLAFLLRQESDVRLADGDIMGALDSRLTGVEMSVAIRHGMPSSNLVYAEVVEGIALGYMEPLVAKLDAATIRAILPRFKSIDAYLPSYTAVVKADRANAIRFALDPTEEALGLKSKKLWATPEGRQSSGLSEEKARDILALTPATLAAQINKVFDDLFISARQPFSVVMKRRSPPAPNWFVAQLIPQWNHSYYRYHYELQRTYTRFIQASLELRAIKLETGVYPRTYKAPFDPFGNNSRFIYRRLGDKYLLYSVGSDGKDDDAGDPLTPITDAQGVQSRVNSMSPYATGDIVAPIL